MFRAVIVLFFLSTQTFSFDRDRVLNNRRFINISAVHTDGFKDDIDSSSTFSFFGSYRLTKRLSVSALQAVRKFYVYDKFGGEEFAWNDTRLGVGYIMPGLEKYFDFVRLGALYHFPTSRLSSERKLNGRFQSLVTFTKRFFSSKLNVSYTPYATVNLNRKKQTLEGDVNTRYVLGNRLSVSYILGHGFLVGSSVGFGQTYDESGDFQSNGRESGSGFVDVSASVSWQINNNWSLVGGYAHGESQEKGGAIEFYAFDPDVSSWFLSTSLSFF